MVPKERAEQISGGVFLIGLALLLLNVMPFWPGILFVLGAASIARGMAQGSEWYNASGGLWLIGLGVIFLFGFNWPLLLILLGLSMLFGYRFQQNWPCGSAEQREKRKNDSKRKNDEADDTEPQLV